MVSMLNHAAVEALCSATYLEDYLDCMENLPDDLQRVVSQLRELDSVASELVADILYQKGVYVNHEDGAQKKKALITIQRKLIKSQELGDEKLALVSNIIEHVENRTRQLEQDLENLDPGMSQSLKEHDEVPPPKMPVTPSVPKSAKPASVVSTPVPSTPVTPIQTPVVSTPIDDKIDTSTTKLKRQRRQRMAQDANHKDDEKKNEEDDKPKKKKKRKTKKDNKGHDRSTIDPPIDPDEPTYCLCDQVSYGEMIGCDYDKCEIEWFHFNCVGLTHKPKGKWFCPKCRGDKPTVMRPDLLEALRKEKAKGN